MNRSGFARRPGDHVCPWWFIHSFDNPLRRLLQDPDRILKDFVGPGDRCLDVGCGYGYFTIPMARAAGPEGRVDAVDIQPEMLAGAMKRAQKAALADRINLHLAGPSGSLQEGMFDFALAFWMIHEVPDQKSFLAQIKGHLKPNGRFLLVEPKMHVGREDFNRTVGLAEETGLRKERTVRIRFSRGVLFSNSPSAA